MNIYEQLKEIEKDYYNCNYVDALNKIDIYLKIKNNGIDENLLNIYINCQIQMGMLEEAIKNLELMDRLYPEFYSDLKLALKYISCGKIDKLNEILSRGNLSEDYDYFSIAEACFFKGQHEKAEELFLKILSFSKNEGLKEGTRKFLRRIEIYKNDKSVFVETSYSYFKSTGQQLCPGHVIHVSKLRDGYKENIVSEDPKKGKRPYMVWRVIDDKVYAFSMSTQVNYEKDVILSKDEYQNREFDRVVTNELVCICEKDIESVIDMVKLQHYNDIIRNIYIARAVSSNIVKQTTKFFMDTVTSEIDVRKNDIIAVYDFSVKNRKYYFVLGIDSRKGKYNVMEVKRRDIEQFSLVDNDIKKLSLKTPILEVIRLEEKETVKLRKKIPINYRVDSMIGSIVNVGNKKLEILIEEEKFYICIDRTFGYSASFIMVEVINKNIPLSVIEQLSQEIYQSHLYTLRDYLKRNPDEIKRKKKLL